MSSKKPQGFFYKKAQKFLGFKEGASVWRNVQRLCVVFNFKILCYIYAMRIT